MMNQGIFSRMFKMGLPALAALFLLAGCAPTLSAKVTSFQQWPTGVEGQAYRFDAPDNEQNALEYAAYQDMMRAAIGATGLVEAKGNAPAKFRVSFHYGGEAIQVVRSQSADPYFYGGLGHFHGPWGWGGMYSPDCVNVLEDAWRHALTVEIRDTSRNNAEVYRSTATTVGGDSSTLPSVMPYLVQAVFDNFPGNNGQVREVRYRRQ